MAPPPTRTRSPLRARLLQIHLYGGLATFWYLLAYGVTSLGFNHPWLLPDPPQRTEAGSVPYTASAGDARARAEAAAADAGIAGWYLPWTVREDGRVLRFDVQRPGYVTHVTADAQAGLLTYERVGPDLAGMLHFLHGSTHPVPGLPGTRPWGWYTDVTTALVLFFCASGVWLFWERTASRRIALGVLAAGGAVFAALAALLLAGA